MLENTESGTGDFAAFFFWSLINVHRVHRFILYLRFYASCSLNWQKQTKQFSILWSFSIDFECKLRPIEDYRVRVLGLVDYRVRVRGL